MRRWVLAAALPLLLLGWGLSDFGLLNNVEGLYAEIAREMLASDSLHGWVIPHVNGLPYIEKPPLLYWLIAASMAVFGTHDWAVRLVPVLAGVLTLIVVAAWATRLRGPRAGATSLFVLGTTTGFVLMTRVALTDALLMACLTAAWLLAYLALVEQRRLWWRLSLLALAFGMMGKGFVALALFGLVGLAHMVFSERNRWRQHLRLIADPWAVGLFLLVVVPWHMAASLELPEFAWFYFINEHVLRYLGLREPKDYYEGTVFYYLPRLALMALPWWPLGLFAEWRRRQGDALPAKPAHAPIRFLWVCVLVPLAFFSVSSAKANYYVLVCLPPLTLLIAWRLECWREVVGRSTYLKFWIAGLTTLPALLMLQQYGRNDEPNFSARPMAQLMAKQPEHLPVFLYQDYEDYSGLPFYLQSDRIGVVDQQSADLHFGLGLSDDAALYPSVAEFVRRAEPAWLIVLDARVRRGMPHELAAHIERVSRVGNATLYRLKPLAR